MGSCKTGQKQSVIIVFPLGFREAFSLLPSCLCGFIRSNTMELGGFGKDTWISDKIHYLFEDSCELMSHPWQGKGWTEHADIPQLPPCMDRVIPYNPHSVFYWAVIGWNKPSKRRFLSWKDNLQYEKLWYTIVHDFCNSIDVKQMKPYRRQSLGTLLLGYQCL